MKNILFCACVVLLSASIPVASLAGEEGYNLTAAVREAVAAGTCSAPGIKGSATQSWVASNVFDGITSEAECLAEKRWLGSFSASNSNASHAVYCTYTLPDDFNTSANYVLTGCRLHRIWSNDYDVPRVPTAWAFYGVTEEGAEELICTMTKTDWKDCRSIASDRSAYFDVPEEIQRQEKGWRSFKFVPLASASTDSVNFGLYELELFARMPASIVYNYSYDAETTKVALTLTISDAETRALDVTIEVTNDSGETTSYPMAKGLAAGTHTLETPALLPGGYTFKAILDWSDGTQELLSEWTLYCGQVSIQPVNDAAVAEGRNGLFAITRTPVGPATPSSYAVCVVSGGDAIEGVDYVPISSTIQFPAGESEATLTVIPKSNRGVSETRTLTVSLGAGNYTVPEATSSATINLLPAPESWYCWHLSMTTTVNNVTRPDNNYKLTVSVNGDRLTVKAGVMDTTWPTLNLNDPVLDDKGNRYWVTSINGSWQFYDTEFKELILPETLEEIPSNWTFAHSWGLERLVMRTPRLRKVGSSFLGYGMRSSLSRTTLEDLDFSSLETIGDESLGATASGVRGRLLLPALVSMGHSSLGGHRFEEVVLGSPDLKLIGNNGFSVASLTNVYFATTNSLTLGTKAFNNGKTIRLYTFEGPSQPDATLDTLTSSAPDYQIVIYASRHQGWAQLSGVVTSREEIRASLTEAQQTLYAARLEDPALIGLLTTVETERKVWLMHRPSRYDPQGMFLLIR